MARSQSTGALIGKWIVVPILVALFGYFVVGPKFGSHKKKVEEVQTSDISVATGSTSPEKHSEASPTHKVARHKPAEPELDISVEKIGSASTVADADPEAHPRKRTRRKKTEEDLPVTKDPSDNQSDEGGSGGATTAG